MPDDNDGNMGYLTMDEWDRLLRAVSNAHTHIGWWRIAGHIRLGDLDEHRTRASEMPLPLPGTWLAAEEVSRLLGELNRWPGLEDAANDMDGVEFAYLFIREVETAMAKWPMSERPHNVRFFRCTACNQATLRYFPPTIHRTGGQPQVEDSKVKCTDKTCRTIISSAMFERMAVMVEMEQRAREQRRVDSDRKRARKGEPVSGHDLPVDSGSESADVEARQDLVGELA